MKLNGHANIQGFLGVGAENEKPLFPTYTVFSNRNKKLTSRGRSEPETSLNCTNRHTMYRKIISSGANDQSVQAFVSHDTQFICMKIKSIYNHKIALAMHRGTGPGPIWSMGMLEQPS